MTQTIAGITVPDSALATEATELVREAATDLVYHHCRRVFLFGSLRGIETGVQADPELLYVGAIFHDLGLTETFARDDQRFEIDGADEARRFLTSHGIDQEQAEDVWRAIALHTTPEIPLHMSPVVQLVTRGVELDVMGIGYDSLTDQQREEITAAHPRPDFKQGIIDAFHGGLAHRPGTTFGNVKSDVMAYKEPGFERENFVEKILGSDWAE